MEKLNIAIADDNALMVQLLDQIVSSDEELRVVGKAGNGEELIDIIREKKPDVVLMDIIMPKLDGLKATEWIRHSSHEQAQEIPIIAMTANAFAEDVEKSLAAGMNAHLVKPIDIDKLLRMVQDYAKSVY